MRALLAPGPGHELTLARNPRFHEWPLAAQPAGYPDRIVWKFGIRLDDALSAIERGGGDWVLNYGPLPSNRPPRDRNPPAHGDCMAAVRVVRQGDRE